VVKFEEKLPIIHIKNTFWLKKKNIASPASPQIKWYVLYAYFLLSEGFP
jgi:hypothetical protein